MPSLSPPDYAGGSLVNLIASLERRLTGSNIAPSLHAALEDLIPVRDTYVVVMFDGLGTAQLDHEAALELKPNLAGSIDAPFPATTTVSLATVATGLPPSQHGLLGYQLWLPQAGVVANTIHWTTLWGEPIDDLDLDGFLPAPNLWERLQRADREPITVQPHNFENSRLSRVLYRGCRYEGVATVSELIEATAQLAELGGRLIFTYLPHVDFAAHVHGQNSSQYREALEVVAAAWTRLALALPADVALIGTADHGHVDFPPERQVRIAKADHTGRVFYGDGRAMFVKGPGATLAEVLPATWYPIDDCRGWWGPGPLHQAFSERSPDGVLVADDDVMLLHRHSDDRMIGGHGALTAAERVVPLLVRNT